MIRTALAQRRLHPCRHGIYAVGHLAQTAPAVEALLDVGDDAVLVGTSVLVHHGVIHTDDVVHVAVTSARRPRARPGMHVHYFRGLDCEFHDGLPMTSVARALLDAALDLEDVGAVVDEAVLALRKTTNAQIRRVLAANPGHPGHARLAAVLAERRPAARTESKPAAKMLELIRAAGLPEPQTEVWLLGYRADKYWPELGLVLEVDSFGSHGLIRKNYKRDRRKDRVYHAHGLEVMRVDADEIYDEPLKVVAELSAAITRLQAARAA